MRKDTKAKLLNKLDIMRRATGMKQRDIARLLDINECYLNYMRRNTYISRFKEKGIKMLIQMLEHYQKKHSDSLFGQRLVESKVEYEERKKKLLDKFKTCYTAMMQNANKDI